MLDLGRVCSGLMSLSTPRRLIFLLLPDVHVLDLSGPVQAFWEANAFGGAYSLTYCAPSPDVVSAQGLAFGGLEPLPEVTEGDRVVVAGTSSQTLYRLETPVAWLRSAVDVGAEVCSICSGAFVLARAGLLDGRSCTTHWKVAERLRSEYPAARVLGNRLFVRDGPVVTSAGVVSGIDTALWLIEGDYGAPVAARTARELVVYLRRDAAMTQNSIYLDHRTHLNDGVHRVQDWFVAHPEERPPLDQLARIACMSPRHLTRVFKRSTGMTLKDFSNRLKLTVAENLLRDPRLTVDTVANRCGFENPRQLRRLWKRRHGVSPSEWKHQQRQESSP